MGDRPILFSGPMVRALLDGRKTQTRRIHSTQDPEFRRTCDEGCDSRLAGMCLLPKSTCGRRWVTDARFAVGDRLWVREAWRTTGTYNGLKPSVLSGTSPILFEADGESGWGWAGKLRPSMFMPRWASRLTLVVSEVRVERLQDISKADAIAEGIEFVTRTGSGDFYRNFANPGCPLMAYGAYRSLWDSLNAKRGYGWDANPWVVAVSFDVVKANIDRMTASPYRPLQDDADASVSVIKDAGPPDKVGAPAPRSAFDRDGEVNRG